MTRDRAATVTRRVTASPRRRARARRAGAGLASRGDDGVCQSQSDPGRPGQLQVEVQVDSEMGVFQVQFCRATASCHVRAEAAQPGPPPAGGRGGAGAAPGGSGHYPGGRVTWSLCITLVHTDARAGVSAIGA